MDPKCLPYVDTPTHRLPVHITVAGAELMLELCGNEFTALAWLMVPCEQCDIPTMLRVSNKLARDMLCAWQTILYQHDNPLLTEYRLALFAFYVRGLRDAIDNATHRADFHRIETDRRCERCARGPA